MSARRGSYPVAVECPLDPRWMTIGRALGVPPFTVAGVWQVVMMQAATSQPRGRASDLNVADLATFNACETAEIEAILGEFRARNMIAEDDRVLAWGELLGTKKDPTGAARQQRHRDRRKDARNAVTTRENPRRVTGVTRDADPCHARNDRDEKGGDMGGFALTTAFSPEKLSTSNKRSVARALARDEIIEELEAEQAGGGVGWTLYNTRHLSKLVSSQVTGVELHAAIERARGKRVAEGSKQRINVGLVAAMLDDIRTRIERSDPQSPARSLAGNSPAVRETPETKLRDAIAARRRFVEAGTMTEAQAAAEIDVLRARLGLAGGEATA